MKVVILAGGLGTRFPEESVTKPKPMAEVGGFPLLWHIMKIYSFYGHREFIVALGEKSDVAKRYFTEYHRLSGSLSVRLADGEVKLHGRRKEDWVAHLVDTGPRTQTGGRLLRVREWLGQETFMMTYGDGVASVRINRLVAFHKRMKRKATLTMARPPARYGRLSVKGNLVRRFEEKRPDMDRWINGGFFVLEPAVLDYIEGDETVFERGPLEALARQGQLAGFRHSGFWLGMDNLGDHRHLEELWREGRAPWKVW